MNETLTEDKAKPVTIISGFLGAGKTSFLNHLTAWHKSTRPAIIENEFGEEGIDAGLLMAPDADIFELNSGCLCCSLNDELLDLLDTLLTKRKEFDELIIETTGIADPAGVAQPFMAVAEIARYFRLERVICIVDAKLVKGQLEQTTEARKQIAFADIIIVNKCDTVDQGHLHAIEDLLKAINPFAAVFSGNKAAGYPLEQIMQLTRSDFDNGFLPTVKASPVEQPVTEKHCHHHNHEHEKIHHHHDITSLSFVFDRPFNLELFEHRLLIFLNFQAKDIYRVKGYIWGREQKRKKIVQSVSNLLAVTEGEEWDTQEIPKSRIVFIGKDLTSKGLENMLVQCLDKSYVREPASS